MFKWLKSLFAGPSLPEIVNEAHKEAPKEEQPKPVAKPKEQPKKPASKTTKKTATKKTTTKKSGGKCDFDKLTKTQLLAEAKHRGVKANASLSKAEILKRLKENG